MFYLSVFNQNWMRPMIGARASLEFRSCYSFYVFVNVVVVVVVFCSESLTEAASQLTELLPTDCGRN